MARTKDERKSDRTEKKEVRSEKKDERKEVRAEKKEVRAVEKATPVAAKPSAPVGVPVASVSPYGYTPPAPVPAAPDRTGLFGRIGNTVKNIGQTAKEIFDTNDGISAKQAISNNIDRGQENKGLFGGLNRTAGNVRAVLDDNPETKMQPSRLVSNVKAAFDGNPETKIMKKNGEALGSGLARAGSFMQAQGERNAEQAAKYPGSVASAAAHAQEKREPNEKPKGLFGGGIGIGKRQAAPEAAPVQATPAPAPQVAAPPTPKAPASHYSQVFSDEKLKKNVKEAK